uniref:Uncharacterized protein n=1 Tax=Tetranychus urticae TaxID=32264 RepID=T1KCN6_TETUR
MAKNPLFLAHIYPPFTCTFPHKLSRHSVLYATGESKFKKPPDPYHHYLVNTICLCGNLIGQHACVNLRTISKLVNLINTTVIWKPCQDSICKHGFAICLGRLKFNLYTKFGHLAGIILADTALLYAKIDKEIITKLHLFVGACIANIALLYVGRIGLRKAFRPKSS